MVFLKKHLEKGYIRKVPAEERQLEQAWYLLHFPLLRPDKSRPDKLHRLSNYDDIWKKIVFFFLFDMIYLGCSEENA